MTFDSRATNTPSGLQARSTPAVIILWSGLGLAGLLFWFILGFPFHHHNESYVWAVLLQERGFLDATLVKLRSVANHRPLGQAIAWLTFRLSEGSVAPAQVVNIAIALFAWLTPLIGLRQRRSFAVAALVSGGMLFSGYIYAFHMHGVFYSPVLLLTGFLALAATQPMHTKSTIWLALGAALAALFHPYALLLFLAWAFGAGLECRSTLTRKEWTLLGIAAAFIAGLVLVLVILPGNAISTTLANRIAGLHATYRSTELHPIMTVGVGVLVMLTVAGTQAGRTVHTWFAGMTAVALGLSLFAGLPLVYLWIAVAGVRMLLQGRIRLASLIACAAILPAIAPTGSPTYAVYVLLLCTVAMVVDFDGPEVVLAKLPAIVPAAVLCVTLVLAGLLRMDVHVPVLSGVTSPLTAERERTLQLESILAWWESSTYQNVPVSLGQKAPNPVDVKDAADRRFRPPTSQVHLDTYTHYLLQTRSITPAAQGRLMVLFGGAESQEGAKVFTLPGGAAGPATVYFIP